MAAARAAAIWFVEPQARSVPFSSSELSYGHGSKRVNCSEICDGGPAVDCRRQRASGLCHYARPLGFTPQPWSCGTRLRMDLAIGALSPGHGRCPLAFRTVAGILASPRAESRSEER